MYQLLFFKYIKYAGFKLILETRLIDSTLCKSGITAHIQECSFRDLRIIIMHRNGFENNQ